MKIKVLIWVGLLLQLAFLLVILFQAPEPFSAITIGLDRLKSNCPTEMMMGTKTPEGNLVLNTAGDYFSIAGEGFEFITGMSMGLGLVNVIISTLLLLALRKKNKDLSIAIT